MRHTVATLLLATGVHPKVVQERLGHSSIQMTLDLYSYVSATMQQDAADILDQLLGDVARQSAATMPDKATDFFCVPAAIWFIVPPSTIVRAPISFLGRKFRARRASPAWPDQRSK